MMISTCPECSTTITEKDIQYGTIARCFNCGAVVDGVSRKHDFPDWIKTVEKPNTEIQNNYRAEVSRVQPFELTFEYSTPQDLVVAMILALVTGSLAFFLITGTVFVQMLLGWICVAPFTLIVLIIAVVGAFRPKQTIELTPSEFILRKGAQFDKERKIPLSELKQVLCERQYIRTNQNKTEIYADRLVALLADGTKIVIQPARDDAKYQRTLHILRKYIEKKANLTTQVANEVKEEVDTNKVRIELQSSESGSIEVSQPDEMLETIKRKQKD